MIQNKQKPKRYIYKIYNIHDCVYRNIDDFKDY